MGAEFNDVLSRAADAAYMIGMGAVGAGVDCMAKMRDRRNKLKWWELILTFFIGTAIGWMFGYVANLYGSPVWMCTGIASGAGYLNTRLTEFVWKQFKTTVSPRSMKD